MQQIADELHIPYHLIVNWSGRQQWSQQRKMVEQEMRDKLIVDTIKFQADHRQEVLKRHVALGEKFEGAVQTKLNDATKDPNKPVDSRTLADLGKAMQAGTTVAARAVGIDRFDVQAEQNQRVAVLINNNVNPTPVSPDRRAKTFDAEVVEPRPVTSSVSSSAVADEPDPF